MAITSQPGVYPSIGEEGGMKVGIVDGRCFLSARYVQKNIVRVLNCHEKNIILNCSWYKQWSWSKPKVPMLGAVMDSVTGLARGSSMGLVMESVMLVFN